ncbi:DNA invertase Pin-like site-specific DNA recombinase [Elusimicrobium simillimum]|uniref:recombinase family protein n=1 Tax=Elusimicrobium simillimum TaxID=3143438 RepID=UPI003C6EC8EB
MNKVNCAIYVRKSTEHGLELEFNSLHNQEEACKAYVASQTFNRWGYHKTYSDGGISGGTMERPGLQKMLKDVRDGNVNMVVVYKVDRLSRSIVDFHKMIQELERYNCNFVSVTQAFDTSNSMGKLTLNMLLSFAQFEREVGSERVRDKIAATKAKGMWVGGTPPLGYDLVDKKLIPNPKEAEMVNNIFNKYLDLESILKLKDWTVEQGYKAKEWKTKKGHMKGGKHFLVATLHEFLRKQLYIGMIEHKSNNKVYKGQHEGIVPKDVFDKVQEMLGRRYENKVKRKKYEYAKCLFNKNLVTADGKVFLHTSSKKSARRFNYYYIRGGNCIPTEQIDKIALAAIGQIRDVNLRDMLPEDTKLAIKHLEPFHMSNVKNFLSKGLYLKKENISELMLHVNISEFIKYTQRNNNPNYLNDISIRNDGGITPSNDKKELIIKVEFVIDNTSSTKLKNTCSNNILTISQMNESLVRAIAYGWKFAKAMESGETVTELEKESGLQRRRIYKYINLTYLSPRIIEDIFENRNPKNTKLNEILDIASSNSSFIEQERKWYKREE